MLFHSAPFLLFIAVVLPLFGALRGRRSRQALLLVASYLFYTGWDYRYLPLLVVSTLVDYAVGPRLHRETRTAHRRVLLAISLSTNLGLLAVFKYGNLLLSSLVPLWSALDVATPVLPGVIPVGISFYTFQTLSYTIDLYRRKTDPCDSLLEFATFVAFFPQLVAGPIIRSRELLPQLRALSGLRSENIAEGAQRFILGLFKKVVIADNAALFVDAVFAAPEQHGAWTLWCGSYAFALQIYCDFSGYTDMAIGLGRAFGLKFPENFDAPYLSRSLTEFWRRWHQSLSRWLRDYLYIPLGGSRRGVVLTYRNLALTMLLGGLWHGASWTFVAWGAVHGAVLAVERALGIGRKEGASAPRPIVRLLCIVATFHVVCLAWVMFRAESFGDMGIYLTRMFTGWTQQSGAGLDQGLRWAAVLIALCATQAWSRARSARETVWNPLPPHLQAMALTVLILSVAVFRVTEAAFIYFQF